MSPIDAANPARALAARLALLALVIVACGALVGGLFLPSALAVTDVVESVQRDVLNVEPLPSDNELERIEERSVILAADGTKLATILDTYNRVYLQLDQIPEVVRDAVIATEDADFWTHNGINHTAILRAALANVRSGQVEQGGSTITQQYVKNVILSGDRTLERKIKEAVYAVELERRWSKEKILENYLNRTYLGNGVYGVGAAAEFYFGKSLHELAVGEAAVLAGIIRSPENNEPRDNPENARRRRDLVLDQMAAEGYLTRAQAEAEKAKPLSVNITPLPEPESPFFATWITRLLTNRSTAEGLGTQVDAMHALGDTPQERIAAVFQGGLRIHTTVDPGFQRQAEEAIAKYVNDPLTDPLAGIVSVEPGTGAIRTMAIGPKTHGECTEDEVVVAEDGRLLCDKTKFNPVVPADTGSRRVGRQPGSSFKPYVIAAALEAGIPPGWEVEATGPQTIPGCDNGGPWRVNNAGGNGQRNMYSGVAGSSNVFHARLIKEVGDDKVAALANRVGIKSLDPETEANCSLALGAEEIFPLEHAAAYATFANEGVYCAPYPIERIEDHEGNLIWEHTVDCTRAVDEDVALRVIDIMKGPVSRGGTAPVANLGRWPTRGKTGTTNDWVDAWFVGYVRQLATAAWIGYENGVVEYATTAQAETACPDQHRGEDALEGNVCIERKLMTGGVTIGGKPYNRVYGGTIPAPMWKAYMEQAVQRFEPEGWPSPGSMPGATVPDVLGAADVEEAEDILDGARLNLHVLEVPDYRPPGTPVAQNPLPGTGVLAGSLVIVEVSNGEGEVPAVPNVVGLVEKEAVRVLTEAGYKPRILTKPTNDKEQDGVVMDQSPDAGEPYAPGEDAVVVIQVGELRKGRDEPSPSPSASPSPSPSASPSTSPSPSEPKPTPTPTPAPTETSTGGGGAGNGTGNGNPEGD